nr:hypothetical protein [Rickettsia endosymbiont of Ceutorhynchus assimilis]
MYSNISFPHMGLLHGSKKVPYVIPAKAGIQKITLCHPEFISGSFARDAESTSA